MYGSHIILKILSNLAFLGSPLAHRKYVANKWDGMCLVFILTHSSYIKRSRISHLAFSVLVF